MSKDVPHCLISVVLNELIRMLIHRGYILALLLIILPCLSYGAIYQYGEEIYLPNSTVIDEKGNVFFVEESFYPEPGFYRTNNASFYVVELKTSKKIYFVGDEVEIITKPAYAFSSIKINGSVSKRKFIAKKPGYYEIEAEINGSKIKKHFWIVDKSFGILNVSGELKTGNKIKIIANNKADISIIHNSNVYRLGKKREFIIPEEGEYTIKAEIKIGNEKLIITKEFIVKASSSFLEVPEKAFLGEEVLINFSNCELFIDNKSIITVGKGVYSLPYIFNESGVKTIKCGEIHKNILISRKKIKFKYEINDEEVSINIENFTGNIEILSPKGDVYVIHIDKGRTIFYPDQEGNYIVFIKGKKAGEFYFKRLKYEKSFKGEITAFVKEKHKFAKIIDNKIKFFWKMLNCKDCKLSYNFGGDFLEETIKITKPVDILKYKIKTNANLESKGNIVSGYIDNNQRFKISAPLAWDSNGREIDCWQFLNGSLLEIHLNLTQNLSYPIVLQHSYESLSNRIAILDPELLKENKIGIKITKISDREYVVGKFKLEVTNGEFKEIYAAKTGIDNGMFLKFVIKNVERGSTAIFIKSMNGSKIDRIKYVKFINGVLSIYKNTYVANNIAAIYLEDGGEGDEDGVKNGIIVDPGIIISGHVYEDISPFGSNSGEDLEKAGVRVRLFKDNGDLILNESEDSLKLETYTNTSGCFTFKIDEISWWNSSWTLRRPIIITNSNNLTLTDYPVKIILNTKQLINESKLRSDCGDLRFIDSQGNELGYWIKPGTCNTTSTEIWVNVTELKNNSDTKIYVYYNNSDATSKSNATDVFFFYDDFENGLGQWTVYNGFNNFWRWADYRSYEGNYSAAYNHEPPTPPSYSAGWSRTHGYLRSDTFYLGDNAFIFWKEWTETEKTGYSEPPSDAYDNMYFYVSTDGGASWNLLKRWEDSSLAWVSRSVNLSDYQSSNARIQFYFDSVDGLYNNYEGWYIDNVIIRKYQPPEPSASIQGEESYGEPINGTYFVAIEANSIRPEKWNGLQAIPEQTYGSRFLTSLETYPEFGGKNVLISDNWSAGVYEHYGLVNETTLVNLSNLDFGFSFSIVVNNASDGQGSLRQVIKNANAIDNATDVSFIMQTAPTNGKWIIGLEEDLPSVKSANFTIDNSSIVLNAFSLNYTLKFVESNISIKGIEINGTAKGIVSTSVISEGNALPFGEQYVRRILINNSQNSNPLNDYQINFTIDTQSLISAGKMRPDCGDIRFIDPTTEQELSYYIMNNSANACNTPNTVIWVKIPQIPSYGIKIIYMYYGNLSLTPKSSGDETFDFFEDWENGINTTKWTREGSSAALSPYWDAYTQVGTVNPYEGSYFAGTVNLGTLDWVFINSTLSPETHSILTFYWRVRGAGSNRAKLEFIYGSDTVTSITGVTGWLNYNYEITNTESNIIKWKYSTNWNAGGSNRGFLDLIFLRKYIPPEPIVTVGNEISSPERPENLLIKDVKINVNDTAIVVDDMDKVNIENVSIDGNNAIELYYSKNNTIENSTLRCSSQNACLYIFNVTSSHFNNLRISSQGWGIEINNSENNLFSDILFNSSYPTQVSFEYSGNIRLKAVETPPTDPEGYRNIKRYMNITNTTSNAWIFVNFSYSDSDVVGDESTLKVWKYNTTWYEQGWNGTRVLDTVNNIVGVNITDFGSIFAPLVSGLRILGRILEDFEALGVKDADVGIENVTVALFKDINQNETLDLFDIVMAEALTNATGFYNFSVPYSISTYFVTVDAKSVNTTRGLNPSYTIDDIWAEQTFVVTWNSSKNTYESQKKFGGENPEKSDNFGVVFFDGFETWRGWTNYGSGTVSQSSEESYIGEYSLKKSDNNDPNGGYKLLKKSVGRDIILEGYTYRPSPWSGGSIDRIGVEDSSFNGYSFRVHHTQNYISIDRRTGGSATEISIRVSWDPPENEWYFWRLMLYSNGSITFSTYYVNGTLAASVSTTDSTYSQFDRVVVHGGYEYYVDNLCLKSINSNYEHIAMVNASTYTNESIDFGFSFDVVVNAKDVDDDSSSDRYAQGTLRQFIENANAIIGKDRSYFVMMVNPNSQDSNGKWWSITVNSSLGALPTIKDNYTELNGTVFYQNMSIRDENKGYVLYNYTTKKLESYNTQNEISVGVGGDGRPFSGDETKIRAVPKPEVEIYGNGNNIVLDVGANNCTISRLSIFGGNNFGIGVNNGDTLIKEVFVGLRANASDPNDSGLSRNKRGIVVVSSNTTITDSITAFNNHTGISFGDTRVNSGAVKNVQAYKNGLAYDWGNGFIMEKEASNITFENCLASSNAGFGVDSFYGKEGLKVINCTIEYNGRGKNSGGIRVLANNSLIENNLIRNNNGSGVIIGRMKNYPTHGINVTKNSIFNNTWIGIDIDPRLNNHDTYSGDNVTLNDGKLNSSQPNNGIDYPVINFSAFLNNKLYIMGYINNESSTLGSSNFANAIVEFYVVNHDGEGDNLQGNNGYGEGYYYIGSLQADSNGNFEGSFNIDTSKVNVGDNITATATLSNYGTSEFGRNFISAWAFYFGNLSAEVILANMLMQNMTKWGETKGVNLIIYAEQANINFSALQALGKTSSGLDSNNDFIELDERLNMSYLIDSINRTYSKDGSEARETKSFYIYGKEIQSVPVVNSIFDEDFKTGILWDTSDCSLLPCEYDGSQDIVFITEINPNIGFENDYHDYEIRVPVNLQYISGGSGIVFYVVGK